MALVPKRKPAKAKAIFDCYIREGEGCHGTIKKEVCSSSKAKRDCASTVPTMPVTKLEEEASKFEDDNYNPLSTDARGLSSLRRKSWPEV